ncbi:acyl-ACP--UDP-N-acetylglucosamine O-acyltransferase [Lentisphaerota bacterium WC36G]|nr:acyl-ACP--UDP-N-acetylglucosamine O-acyltransferase [Lentisphaerae bacterium WC36]
MSTDSNSNLIHPTAVIAEGAKIGKNVRIGAYAVIEDNTVIGDDCYIDSHVKIARYTSIGKSCRVYYGALVGEEPQDHRFIEGLKSYTEIGNHTVIREYVTIHRPPFEGIKTIIGSHVLLMAFVHIAHDVIIEDNVTIANHTALTGHVHVEKGAVISGYVKIHQFCRIGSLAMIAPDSLIFQDVPPFCMLREQGFISGVNTVGLRRANYSTEQRANIKKAVKIFFFSGLNSSNACQKILETADSAETKQFCDFVKATKRGIIPGIPKRSTKDFDEE